MAGVHFLAIGDELLRGESTEGNGAALAERMAAIGLQLGAMQVIGDDQAHIAAAIDHAKAMGAQVLVCSGGLGPTDDDLTRQAVADATGRALVQSETALGQIAERFAKFGRTMHPANERQAFLPLGATLLENRHGTAPGFAVHQGDLSVACFPGVPREFAAMIDEHLPALLAARGMQSAPRQEVTYRLFGIAESNMQGVLAGLPHYGAAAMRSLPTWPEIRLKLASRGDSEGFGQLLDEVRAALGDFIYGQGDGDSHAAATLRALQAKGAQLAVAESCTGGLLASLLTDVPGASRTLLFGAVSYANSAKAIMLGVDPALIEAHGAVSEPVAAAMALGALQRSGADVAVATSGIAGPDGGTPTKPVGTLCVALADAHGTRAETLHLKGLSRSRFKVLAAHTALDRVRQWAADR